MSTPVWMNTYYIIVSLIHNKHQATEDIYQHAEYAQYLIDAVFPKGRAHVAPIQLPFIPAGLNESKVPK